MKFLSEKAVNYMNRVWGFNDSSNADDMTMFWESDCPEMTCKRLVDAGAVEGNCPEAREMIKVAESISPDMEKSLIKEIIQDYTILNCTNCNNHAFIPKYYNAKDWTEGPCDSCGEEGYTLEGKK